MFDKLLERGGGGGIIYFGGLFENEKVYIFNAIIWNDFWYSGVCWRV